MSMKTAPVTAPPKMHNARRNQRKAEVKTGNTHRFQHELDREPSAVNARQSFPPPSARNPCICRMESERSRVRKNLADYFGTVATPVQRYFQFRAFPSLSHLMVVCKRCARVSSRFASVSHSTYSRRWLGLKFPNVFRAFACFFSAAVK